MLESRIPDSAGILFESNLEPPQLEMTRLRNSAGTGEGEISVLRNKKNKVSVGIPYYENLTSRIHNLGEEIPYEIRKLTEHFDFHYTRLTCSFLPDSECRFEWARFGVNLVSDDISNPTKPISWDISPSEVLSSIKCKKEFSFTPNLKFNIVPDIIEAGLESEFKETKDYVIYEPQITSFGLNGSNIIWDFQKTKEKGIFGNKSLLLLIRSPKGIKVRGKFIIGAEVSSKLSSWIPFPVKNTDDKIVNVEYDLS